MGFLTSDEPPIGVIWVKGNAVFKGYFRNPKLTAEKIDEDGWMKVGDVAILNKNGSLKLVDRLQDFKKLQNGQFISPMKLETIYQSAPMLDQIFVDVNSKYNFLVAIVHINEQKLKMYADVNGFRGEYKDLIKLKDVEISLLKQLEKAGNSVVLSDIELIKKVLIIEKPMSVADDLITGSMKLKRHNIKKFYEKRLEKIYYSVQADKEKFTN
jgi:long-chain acyl-CoA synthetase